MTLTISTPTISYPTGLSGPQEMSPVFGYATASAGAVITWQWYESPSKLTAPFVPIAGATSQNFTVREEDDTQNLELVATATDSTGSVSATSLITSKVRDNPDNQPVVSITGSVSVGSVLKAVVVDANDDYTYSKSFSVSADNGASWMQISTNGSMNVTAAMMNDLIRFNATGIGLHHVGYNGTATVGPVGPKPAVALFTQLAASMTMVAASPALHTPEPRAYAMLATPRSAYQ